MRWLSFEEERRLLEASPEWLKEIPVFVINTGLRQGEILALTWDRVDLTGKTFTILEQKNKGTDTLPLNVNAMGILIGRDTVRSIKTSFVFYNGNGNMIDRGNLSRAFRSAVKKAGIEKFRFHDLRHSFATRLIQNGVDIYIQYKGLVDGRPYRWFCVMRITMQKVCGVGWRYWIGCRMELSQFYHNRMKAGLRLCRNP